MIIEKFGTGKTVEEAKENALLQFGITSDSDVEYDFEIVDLPTKKKLGIFGGSLAKVRVFREVEDEPVMVDEAVKSEKTETVKSTEKTNKPVGKFSEDEVKNVVDYLDKVLTLMGVRDFKTEVEDIDDGIMINIIGQKLGVAIGRKGETIDALQHLVSLVANRGKDEYCRVTLNPGGYREKRESVLVSVAKKSAEKALRIHRNIVLEPMNSYERRIIHNSVQEIEGVESWSVGENDHRRVVIGNKEFSNERPNRGGYRNDRRGSKGGYNRSNGGRYNNRGRSNRPDYKVNAEPTREPKKDNAAPLYGVVKHEDK